MSRSRRMVVETLVGAFWGPRPRRKRGGPSISSVHGGLFRSWDLAEVLFGGFNVIARFIRFRSAKGNVVVVIATCGMHQDHNFSPEQTERDPASFAVIPANVLARDRETVPYCFRLCEVEAMPLNVAATLPFVPGRHNLIVHTRY